MLFPANCQTPRNVRVNLAVPPTHKFSRVFSYVDQGKSDHFQVHLYFFDRVSATRPCSGARCTTIPRQTRDERIECYPNELCESDLLGALDGSFLCGTFLNYYIVITRRMSGGRASEGEIQRIYIKDRLTLQTRNAPKIYMLNTNLREYEDRLG